MSYCRRLPASLGTVIETIPFKWLKGFKQFGLRAQVKREARWSNAGVPPWLQAGWKLV